MARFAMVTPWPPTSSGIAYIAPDFHKSLEKALGERIDLYVSYPTGGNLSKTTARPFSELIETTHNYRSVFIPIANGKHYTFVKTIIENKNPVILLHDCNLLGIPTFDESSHRSSLGLDFLQGSKKILVHSKHALDYSSSDKVFEKFDSKVIALGAPVRNVSRLRKVAPRAIKLSSFGWVDHSKQSEKIFYAFVKLAERHNDWEFVFVGPINQDWQNQMEGLLHRLELNDRIQFKGELEEANYQDELKSTFLAIQLRSHSNGESSGALRDVLGYGIPSIVSDVGEMSDLPNFLAAKTAPDISISVLAQVIEEKIEKLLKNTNWIQTHQTILKWARARSLDNFSKEIAEHLI
jgi:glycosyltransferase involved in cell wall biosynthesis